MGETTAHIFVYEHSMGFTTSWHLKGEIWLQQGDNPSWNINTEDVGQRFWRCSKPATIYTEGIIMAALFYSGNKRVEHLREKIYRKSKELRVFEYDDDPKHFDYKELLSAIQSIPNNIEFLIVSHEYVNPEYCEDIEKLGVRVKVAELSDINQYIQKHSREGF